MALGVFLIIFFPIKIENKTQQSIAFYFLFIKNIKWINI